MSGGGGGGGGGGGEAAAAAVVAVRSLKKERLNVGRLNTAEEQYCV